MFAKNKPNEIYITRVYDAPIKKVWDAWIEPDQVAKWWGPRGFTITTGQKDVRAGRNWTYVMHGPDGVDYPNTTHFLEVEKYSRLVYDHGGHKDRPPLFRVTVVFSELDGKTEMEMSFALATPEAAQETKKFIKSAAGDSTWDRLAEYLSQKDIFVINRSFATPIEKMFELWTNPKSLAQWVAPTGSSVDYFRADIQPNGTSFYVMTGADSKKIYGKAKYLEISKPHRIVYTQSFCDEHEKMARHPLAPTWPETLLTTVTLAEEGPGFTRICLHWEVDGDATAEERAMFNMAKSGMTQGWTGSFDKLEAHIESTK